MCYVRPLSNVLFRPQPQPSKFEITCITMERNTYTVGRKLKSLRPCWKIFDVLGVNPTPKFKMSTFLNFNYYLTSWAFEVSKSAQCTHSQVIASQACLFYFKSRVLRSKTSWNKTPNIWLCLIFDTWDDLLFLEVVFTNSPSEEYCSVSNHPSSSPGFRLVPNDWSIRNFETVVSRLFVIASSRAICVMNYVLF